MYFSGDIPGDVYGSDEGNASDPEELYASNVFVYPYPVGLAVPTEVGNAPGGEAYTWLGIIPVRTGDEMFAEDERSEYPD